VKQLDKTIAVSEAAFIINRILLAMIDEAIHTP
jgi:3-hydroxyacyl-CoA dehydrogenase